MSFAPSTKHWRAPAKYWICRRQRPLTSSTTSGFASGMNVVVTRALGAVPELDHANNASQTREPSSPDCRESPGAAPSSVCHRLLRKPSTISSGTCLACRRPLSRSSKSLGPHPLRSSACGMEDTTFTRQEFLHHSCENTMHLKPQEAKMNIPVDSNTKWTGRLRKTSRMRWMPPGSRLSRARKPDSQQRQDA